MDHASFRSFAPGALMLLSLLSGCKLIDQTTFDPALRARLYPPPKKAEPAKKIVIGPPPLLSIHFSDNTESVDYDDSLRLAVSQAISRKPDVRFDVVTVVADTGDLQTQLANAQRVSGDARHIASDIQAMGVDGGQIALGVRPEVGVTGHIVEIFVH